MYYFIMILVITCAVGFQSWRILLNNYAVEVIGISGKEMGAVQSIREIPGFLALLVIYLLLFIREHRLAALSLAVMGLGISLTGILPGFWGLVSATLIMSFGFHYFETVNQSLTLQHFDKQRLPVVLGRMNAVSAMTNVAAGGVVFGLSYLLNFTQLFVLIGGCVIIAAVWCLIKDPTPRHFVPQKKRMVVKRRYWLFYALTFMAGARRQIFVAFAVFLLVQKFQFTVREIAVLFFVNNAVNYFVQPMVGRAVIRFGEQKVLSLEYLCLMVIFLTYAFSESKAVVGVMYVLDHIFFGFSMAIKSFFQKIADPEDIAPSMAVGFTINHIVAVIIPFLGGVAWMVNYKIPFIGGTVMAMMSLILVQFIPKIYRTIED